MPRITSFCIFYGSISLTLMAACSAPVQKDPECTVGPEAPVVSNLRSTGETCAFDSQCTSHRCSADVVNGGCGYCLDVQKLGQSCDGPQQGCNASAVCQNGICQTTKKGLGESCMRGAKGYDYGECDDEFYCGGSIGAQDQGSCMAAVPVGCACEEWPVRCVGGSYCAENGVCTVPPADSCISAGCPAGEFCDEYQTCKLATLPLGARCGIVDGDFVDNECALGTVCGSLEFPQGGGGPGTITTCLPLPTVGELCIGYRCGEGLFCSEQTTDSIGAVPQRCEVLRTEGEACSNDRWFHKDCAEGLECRNSLCVPACR